MSSETKKTTASKPKNKKLADAMKGNKHAIGKHNYSPTLYKPEYAQALLAYFSQSLEAFKECTDDHGKVQLVGLMLPTLERFAFSIGVCYDTLHSWANVKNEDGELKNPEFSDAYARARTYQAALIADGAMVGAYNSNFAALLLKNFHGWKDKTETDLSVSGAVDLTLVEVELEEARQLREQQQAETEQRIKEFQS